MRDEETKEQQSLKRIYFHETLDVVRQPGTHTRYLDKLGQAIQTEGGNAKGSVSNGCVAAWAPVFLTGRWPELITFWEMQQGWEGFGRHFDEHPELFHEPLERFYGERSGGFDRVLVAADYALDRAQVLAGKVCAAAVLQQVVTLQPAGAADYLARLGDAAAAISGVGAPRLFGAYETAFRNGTEVIVLWAFEDFRSLAALQSAPKSIAGWSEWINTSQRFERSHTGLVLRPASWSPLR